MGSGLFTNCSRDGRDAPDYPPVKSPQRPSSSAAWEDDLCHCGGSSSSKASPNTACEHKASTHEEELLHVSELQGIRKNCTFDPSQGCSDGHPEMAWLNFALVELWPFARDAIVTLLEEQVIPELASTLPPPLGALILKRGDLGEKPPTLGKVLFYRKHKQHHRGIELDIELNWVCNADVELEVPGIISVGIAKLVVEGAVSIVLRPLMNTLPIVGGIQIFMINDPTLDWHFTGAASVAHFPIIQENVRKVAMEAIREQLVLPNRLFFHWIQGREHETDMAALNHPRPESLLRLWLAEAKDMAPNITGKLNAYGIIRIGEMSHRTKTIRYHLKPHWSDDDACDFVVYNQMQFVNLDIYDDDHLLEDTHVGSLRKVTVEAVSQDPSKWWPIYEKKKGKDRISGYVRLRCAVYDFRSENSNPPAPLGAAKTTCLLTLGFRGMRGLPKEYSEGAVIEVTVEGQKHKSMPSIYFEAEQDLVYDTQTKAIDPVVQRLAECLQDQGMDTQQIASISGLDVQSLKKVFRQRPAFTTRWEKGMHLLLEDPRHAEVSLRVILPHVASSSHRTTLTSTLVGHTSPSIELNENIKLKDVLECPNLKSEKMIALSNLNGEVDKEKEKWLTGPFELGLMVAIHGMVPCHTGTSAHSHPNLLLPGVEKSPVVATPTQMSCGKSYDYIPKSNNTGSRCCCCCLRRKSEKKHAEKRIHVTFDDSCSEAGDRSPEPQVNAC